MADDGGVWVKATPGVSTTGGGIYAKVADDGGKWVEIGASSGGLPGIGGWATITAVSGTYKPRHEYNDGPGGVGGTDWVAYEFTDDGTLTTSDGLVDALLMSGGRGANKYPTGDLANGGAVGNYGIEHLDANQHDVIVGVGGTTKATDNANEFSGKSSSLGPLSTPNHTNGRAAGATETDSSKVIVSAITGVSEEYGKRNQSSPRPNKGDGANWDSGSNASSGVVIVRVPKEYADNVQETFHAWDSFALVTDGVVTEVTKVPDNQPRTLSNEWVDAPAEVSVGWIYDGSEFVPPAPPSNEDLIAELEARVEELRKA
jgi:hypothetical protein